jgi:multiple sugar transport system substrate-binding protein
LEAAAALDDPPIVAWDRQPLEGFESHPIADLATRYDLIVLDHPHLGEAIAENCLQPVQDWFPAVDLVHIAATTIGSALASYRWANRHFALPLDVAAQVIPRDPVRLPEAPDTWDEVEHAASRVPVALSTAGPYAALTFLSLCVSFGEPPGGEDFISDGVGREALARMRQLARSAPAGSDQLNPIGLLEAIATGESITMVPLVYGYAPYTTPTAGQRGVAFSEAPRMAPSSRRGSVLGGTGIALSARARPSCDLVRHVSWLMSEEAQTAFIPARAGQPSHRAAWTSEAVNQAAGNFYRATLETVETAYVRPRFDGWITFQTSASKATRAALTDDTPAARVLSSIRDRWHTARAAARGALDA